MMRPDAKVEKVYLHPKPVDFRKSIDGLAALVELDIKVVMWVDIRRSSPAFGKWVGAVLSAENHNQLWILARFAHGFITLSETAEFQHKTTKFYSTKSEHFIAWNDPAIGIE